MNCLLGETKLSSANTATNNNSNINNNSSSSTSNSSIQSNNNKISNCNNLNISTNITHHTSTTTTTINSQETCLICGDVASGKHYGLRSCEACKAFFKRTVQGKIEYSCPATRECEINKRRRKACQACRFQKCLNMGMLKEGVRLDRVRGGRQKYRRGLSPGPCGNIGNNSNINSAGGISNININANLAISNNNNHSGINNSGIIASNGLQHINNNNNNNLIINTAASSSSSLSALSTLGSSNLCTNETNRIMTALINCEPEELTASPSQYVTNIPSSLSIQIKTLYILSDLFDRELVSLIGWAKQIPGFSETITLNDQMRLLQSTWAEVIALSIGYRSHLRRMENHNRQQHGNTSSTTNNNSSSHHSSSFITTTPSPTSSSPASTASSYNTNLNTNGNNSSSSTSPFNLENTEIRLVFAKDLIIDFKHAVACGAEEIFYNCVQLIKRLDYLKITPKEYIILKAISLTNADVRLENPKATHQLRDLIMDTLYEATLIDQLTSNNTDPSTSNSNNINSQKDNIGNNISMTGNHQLKVDAQERPLSSMNQYASISPPRPSSSLPSSSSLSSISSHNNNNNNNNNSSNNNPSVDISNLASKKTVINYRLNQVLLCLPVLRQIDSCIRKFWNDVRKGPNSVPMNKLFEEMLEPCQRIYKSSAEM